MPIISQNNDTTYKSLRYGSDQLNNGSSGQPYITTDVNTGLTKLNLVGGILGNKLKQLGVPTSITISNKIGKDSGLIRGGILGATTAGIVDAVRISSFIVNNPLWVVKQVGLQLSNPRLETPKNIKLLTNAGNILSLSTKGLIQPTRIYNLGLNTVAQTSVNAFGVHFNRHGLGPNMDDNQKYEQIVKGNNDDFVFGSKNNRLIGLKSKLKIYTPGDNRPFVSLITSIADKFGLKINGSFLSKIDGIIADNTPIDSYITGPESTYGIGSTLIKRYQNTTKGNELADKFAGYAKTRIVDSKSYSIANYLGLSNQVRAEDSDFEDKIKLSFNFTQNSNLFNNEGNSVKYSNPSLKKYSELFKAIKTEIKQEIPFSNSGSYKPQPFQNQPFSKERQFFKTRAIPVNRDDKDFKYYGNSVSSLEGSRKTYNNTNIFDRYDSDILTVIFRGVDPFTLAEDQWNFSAYLSGYRDDFSGTWNDINYIGRSETFYIYSKFKRSVSFGLKIPCFNRIELYEKHRALGQLASTTAGRYNPNNNALGGVVLRLNVGNYLVGEYAILNSLSYSIPDDATWDTTPEAKLSMYIDASFSFNIIHQNIPQYKPNDGFFGYLPDTIEGNGEFIRVPNRTKDQQNKISSNFAVNLNENDSDTKGNILSENNPQPVIGKTSRFTPK